jgi:2-keto-4-pentenoate hydratase/2-oxohepta-3-ene-1,7-dioic acid hydratase in catechol pathway
MKLVGVRRPGEEIQVARLEDDETVVLVAGLAEFWQDPYRFLDPGATGPRAALAELEQGSPVLPGARVIRSGLNYLKHVAEGSYAGAGVPEHPTLFARWTASLSVGGTPIPVPANEPGLAWEGEVVAYVGSTLVDADPEEALAAVVGYSTFNDVTARTAQKLTSQWILGKNADRSGPLGPLVPAAEVGDQPGDLVEVEVDKLATLTNPIVGNDVRHAELPGRTAVGR